MSDVLSTISAMYSPWYITRAAGLTAYLLLFLVITCGLMLSMRRIPARYRPAADNVHKTAAAACLFFTLAHVAALLVNQYLPFSFADVLVPFRRENTGWELATGVFALHALVLVTITSVSAIMKLLGNKLWRFAHYFAFPCFWFSLYHGFKTGTDSTSPFVTGLYAVTAGVVVLVSLLRIWTSVQKRGKVYEHSACGR